MNHHIKNKTKEDWIDIKKKKGMTEKEAKVAWEKLNPKVSTFGTFFNNPNNQTIIEKLGRIYESHAKTDESVKAYTL
jgi:hypothetical protein